MTKNENVTPNAKKSSVSSTTKAGLSVPIPKIARKIKQSRLTKRTAPAASAFLAGSVEYILKEILSFTADHMTREGDHKRIIPRDIMLTLRADNEFARLFAGHRILAGDKIKTSADEMMLQADKDYLEKKKKKKKEAEEAAAPNSPTA
jgi:histone H3/H4